jgi:hypothetical protein
MSAALTPFLLVAVSLPVLLLMQRWIHRHLHGLSLLLTGDMNWATIVYAIILFPGVLLHELSHWLMAKLLGVRTGSLSLLPQRKADGAIQLGYVEYYKGRHLGPIRETLVGGAPLLTGTAVVLLLGLRVFRVADVAAAIQIGDVESLTLALGQMVSAGDFFIWLYLLFAVSNAMMPSASDRRAWPAFLLILGLVGLLLYVLDLQHLLWSGLAGPVAVVFGYLGMAFSLTVGANIVFMILIYLLEWFVGRLKGVELVYGQRSERDVTTYNP